MMARLELNLTINSKRAISVSMSKHCWTLKDRFESQFSAAFYPILLSNTKRAEIIKKAEEIRTVRNDISVIYHNHMEELQDISRYNAYKYFHPLFKNRLSGHYLQKAIDDVWIAYQKRFRAIQTHIAFVLITKLVPSYYKKQTKFHKIGELKSIERHTQKTELTSVLTWLARYGTDKTVSWLTQQCNLSHSEKHAFYKLILSKIQKFGYERLIQLAKSRRYRVLQPYKERGPIIFTSLSFHARSRINRPIVDLRKNPSGHFSHYIEVSWDWSTSKYHGTHSNTLCIPIKYNKHYHRSLSRYCNGENTSYTVVIKHKRIYFVLERDGYRYKSIEPITDENTIGIDVNSKHNMFAISDGNIITNDIDLIHELESELIRIDQKHTNHNNNTSNINPTVFRYSKRDTARINAISNKLNESNKRTIAHLCYQYAKKGIKHIVMENLNGFKNSKLCAKDEFGINLGRLHLRTRISSLKTDMLHIAPCYGIQVSLVHPEYTSKMCSVCGCIDDRNRQTQETFCCVECGHTENADIHAAKNIKFRLTSTVLRGNLLERARDSGYKYFQPKSLLMWQVRKCLEKCRCSGLFQQSVEHHNSLDIPSVL